jgi:hypothetical protein
MDEKQWLAHTDPTPMLEFLWGKASDRNILARGAIPAGRQAAAARHGALADRPRVRPQLGPDGRVFLTTVAFLKASRDPQRP